MIYKILNKLFGWDYIQWSNPVDQGISRVHIDGMGRVWYWQYKNIKAMNIIEDPAKVLWLTCSPDKYFPPSVPKPKEDDVLTALKQACRFIDAIPYYINTDGTWNTKDILAASCREIMALREVIERLEGTK